MKIGVIGIGSMGINHARVLSDLDHLYGVSDTMEEHAAIASERFDVKHFLDYKELLSTDIAAVNIAVPTVYHHKVAMDALNAGKHVLLEKPMCSTLAEGQELIDKAHEAGLKLAIGMIERHNPVVVHTKKELENGIYGKIINATSRRVSSFPVRITDVGVIMDLGIHDMDVIRYLASDDVESVYTIGGTERDTPHEAFANISMKFKNGVTGVVEVNWLTPTKVRKIWLTCRKAHLELDYINQALKVSSSKTLEYDESDLYRLPYEYNIRNIYLKKQEPLKNEIQDFVNAIENNSEPLVNGVEGLKSLKVAKTAVASYKTGEKIYLDEFFE